MSILIVTSSSQHDQKLRISCRENKIPASYYISYLFTHLYYYHFLLGILANKNAKQTYLLIN